MWRPAIALGLCLFALVVTGCTTVTGDWTLKKISPAEARDQFSISRVIFNEDGTYEAQLAGQGAGPPRRGTYVFEPRSRLLTLTTASGKQRRYCADRCDMCGYMAITNPENPEAWEAILTPTRK